MDFEFDINIFGAPYSFDLYKGDDWALNYFSIFDNTSEETVKMTVHRIDNKVMYNYLRYGYVTSSGRPGSFFGISVGFKDVYCSDFALMYQLFEGVFQTIIEKGVIFQAQNQYKIQFFTEAEDEIGRIKRVLGQNIRGVVAEKIMPINFTNSEPDKQKAALLSTDAGNSRVWEALNKYAMVSISPNYSGVSPDPASDNVEVIVPADVLMTLSSRVKQIAKSREDISRDVLLFQAEFAKNKNKPTLKSDYDSLISQLKTTISNRNNIILTIKQWCNNNPKNIAALKKLLGRISEIDKKPPTLLELAEMTAIYKDKICGSDENDTDGKENNAGHTTKTSLENNGSSQSPSQKPKENSNKENGFGTGYNGHNTGYGTGIGGGGLGNLLGKHRKSLLGIGAVVLIIIGFVVFYPKNTEEIPPESTAFEKKCDSLMNEARNKFLTYNWAGAYKEYKKIIKKNDTSTNKYTRIEDSAHIKDNSKKEVETKSSDPNETMTKAKKNKYTIIVKVGGKVKDSEAELPTQTPITFVLKINNEIIDDGVTWKEGKNEINNPRKFDSGQHTIEAYYKNESVASCTKTFTNNGI